MLNEMFCLCFNSFISSQSSNLLKAMLLLLLLFLSVFFIVFVSLSKTLKYTDTNTLAKMLFCCSIYQIVVFVCDSDLKTPSKNHSHLCKCLFEVRIILILWVISRLTDKHLTMFSIYNQNFMHTHNLISFGSLFCTSKLLQPAETKPFVISITFFFK